MRPLVPKQLLVGWKSWLCWSRNSHWLHCNQEITTDLYLCEMKLRLQDIVWNLTNQNWTASLRPSYKQICSFFWVLHGNAKCQPLYTLPFREYGILCFKNRPSEWNKCIENAASFFLGESNIMNLCHLPTRKLNKRTVKLEVTIDNKSAPSSSPCVNRLCRAHPLPLVEDIPPWNRWRNNFLIDCRKREMLYLSLNFLDKTKQIFFHQNTQIFQWNVKILKFLPKIIVYVKLWVYICVYTCIYTHTAKSKASLLRKPISKEKLFLKTCLVYFSESWVRLFFLHTLFQLLLIPQHLCSFHANCVEGMISAS